MKNVLRKRKIELATQISLLPRPKKKKKQCLNLNCEGQPNGHHVVLFFIFFTWKPSGHKIIFFVAYNVGDHLNNAIEKIKN